MDPQQKGTIYVILTTFFWGATFILVKETIETVPIDGFLTIRFLIATLILGIIIIFQKKEGLGISSRKTWIYGFWLGAFLYASYFFQTEGLARTTPAKTAFITGMNIVFLPFVGLWPFKQSLKIKEVGVAILAFLGLSLMTINLNDITAINHGDLLVTITALSIAIHVLLTAKAKGIDTLHLIWVQFLTITTLSCIMSLIRGSWWIPIDETYFNWFTLLITAVFATAFAFYAQTMAQKNNVPPSRIVLLFTLEPVFALLVDLLVGTVPTLLSLFGMMVILLANFIYSRIIKEENSIEINYSI